MFNWLRKIVAGSKNRTTDHHYDLDLTYITNRIIAMAFPASGLQQIYRNCISDVSSFLTEHHSQNYFVLNVSGRSYDTEPFGGRVQQFIWEDHQAPCLTTLFQIVAYVNVRLQADQQSVVVVHCNHGKGRTGTAIMSILLFNNADYESVEEVLMFYNVRRFSKEKYKVEQTCQLRYLHFFNTILQHPQRYNTLKAFKIIKVTAQGLTSKCFLRVTQMRNQQIIFSQLSLREFKQNQVNKPLMGDLFIEVKQKGVLMDSRIARINYHLSFLEEKDGKFQVTFQGNELSIDICQSQSFTLTLYFQQFCKCHQQSHPECPCSAQRNIQEPLWSNLHQTITNRPSFKPSSPQFIKLILNSQFQLQQ